jgi:hypothetical protein
VPAYEDSDYEEVAAHRIEIGDTVRMFSSDCVITDLQRPGDTIILAEYTRGDDVVGARAWAHNTVVTRKKEAS